MKHVVLLNPDTRIGKAYLQGNNDGVMDGCPALRCVTIDFSVPGFVHVTRESLASANQKSLRQVVYVPTAAVELILGYDESEPATTIGFAR